eukprot:15304929-Ditylum_brightwellii.AAC.1
MPHRWNGVVIWSVPPLQYSPGCRRKEKAMITRLQMVSSCGGVLVAAVTRTMISCRGWGRLCVGQGQLLCSPVADG